MYSLFGVIMITWWIGIIESRVSRLTPLVPDVTLRSDGKGFDTYEQVQKAFERLKKTDKWPQFMDLSDLWQAANIMTNVMHYQKKKNRPYGMFVDGIKTEADLKKFATADKNGKLGTKVDPGRLILDMKSVPEGSKALFINLPEGVIEKQQGWVWIFLNKGDSISEKLGLRLFGETWILYPSIFLFREKDITPKKDGPTTPKSNGDTTPKTDGDIKQKTKGGYRKKTVNG